MIVFHTGFYLTCGGKCVHLHYHPFLLTCTDLLFVSQRLHHLSDDYEMSMFLFVNRLDPPSLPFCLEQFCGQNHLAYSSQSLADVFRMFECVCTYDTFPMMKCRPLRKCQETTATPAACAWILCRHMWKKAKTGISTHASMPVLWFGCCALANFSEAGQFLFKEREAWQESISLPARSAVGIKFIKPCHLISPV